MEHPSSVAATPTREFFDFVFVDGGYGEESFDILQRFAKESVPSRWARARNEAS